MRYVSLGEKSTKLGFGEAILELAEKNPNLIILGADITASVGLNMVAEKFPERFFSLGIAEQNVTAVAAGLALTGKLPVYSTYSVFAAFRAADQVRLSICYNNVKVIIGGAHAGISVGPDGATHQALEDIALMRALPNMTVISPCDANQAKVLTIAAAEHVNEPIYVRFGREPVPNFTPLNQDVKIGKAQLLCKGSEVAIVATGHMVWEALQAAKLLGEENISTTVVNVHTIKPLDKELLVEVAKQTKFVVTVEEHQVNGGLGGAVAEVLSQNYPVLMDIIGMPDCFGESGKPQELLQKYGLNSRGIYERVRAKLYEKRK